MTTVEELIDFLTKFPPETRVIIRRFSEMDDLGLDEITFVRAEDKQVFNHPPGSTFYIRSTFYFPNWFDSGRAVAPPDATFVTAIIFPGN